MSKNCKTICLSNVILWVGAVIASAILEAPKVLTFAILTPLMFTSIAINNAFVKKLDDGE